MNNSEATFGLESFDLEAIRLRATRHELVDTSHGREALDSLRAEMQCWNQMMARLIEGALFNRSHKILSNQYDCINQTQKLC